MVGKTMGVYLAAHFLRTTLGIFLLFLFLIIAVDFIEFSRRASSVEDVLVGEISQVVFFRAPSIAENILPFTVMFGASITLIVLNRRLELVVARASGVSVWQFLLPVGLAAVLVGLFSSFVYNPLAIQGKIHSSAVESQIFARGKSGSDWGARGFWLRVNQTEGEAVIRAQIAQDAGARLTQVIIYRFDLRGNMAERIDAATASFVESDSLGNHYVLTDLTSTLPGSESVKKDKAILPVSISKSELQANQTTADSISIWSLSEHARRVEQAGKNTLSFATRFQELLAVPLLFVAMVLLASTVSLRFARFGVNAKAILTGVLVGFVLYVITKLLVTFGSNGLVPPFMAAWSSAIVASLLCITVLLHQEDG